MLVFVAWVAADEYSAAVYFVNEFVDVDWVVDEASEDFDLVEELDGGEVVFPFEVVDADQGVGVEGDVKGTGTGLLFWFSGSWWPGWVAFGGVIG